MPEIKPTFNPSTSKVDIEEIYQQALYNPTSAISDLDGDVSTFEALNGGLTLKNIDEDANNTFKSEHFRAGAFARGYFYGFNFPDRYHPSQFTQDSDSTESEYAPETQSTRIRVRKRYLTPSYSLSANVFIPWNSIVYVTYQGFFAGNGVFKHEKGSTSNSDESRKTYIGDYYVNRLYIDGTYQPGTEVRSVASRRFQDPLPVSFENRFRWHHKARSVFLEKGYHDFSVLVGPSIISKLSSDPFSSGTGKQQVFCGSISILSIKAGKKLESDGTPEWYNRDFYTVEDEDPAPSNANKS